VALVDDDEVKEIGLVVLEELLAVEFLVEVLVVREEHLANAVTTRGDSVLVDHDPLVRGKRGERSVRLIFQGVPISQEQHPSLRENATLRELPDQLKDREGLAGAGRHEQQSATATRRECADDLGNGHLLVRPNVLPRHLVNVPRSLQGRCPAVPVDIDSELVENLRRRWRCGQSFEIAGFGVGEQILPAVRGDCEPNPKAAGIPRSLLDSIGSRFQLCLCFEHG
jgi:hypothetical protein